MERTIEEAVKKFYAENYGAELVDSIRDVRLVAGPSNSKDKLRFYLTVLVGDHGEVHSRVIFAGIERFAFQEVFSKTRVHTPVSKVPPGVEFWAWSDRSGVYYKATASRVSPLTYEINGSPDFHNRVGNGFVVEVECYYIEGEGIMLGDVLAVPDRRLIQLGIDTVTYADSCKFDMLELAFKELR